MNLRDVVAKTMNEKLCHNEFGELFLDSIEEAADAIIAKLPECVPDLVWEVTRTMNRNNYHGSEPDVVRYVSACKKYTLDCCHQTGGSWSAYTGKWNTRLETHLSRIKGGEWVKQLQVAIEAANTHNRAAVMASLGVTV